MSSNFTGVTFAKQKVAPSDDAIIRRAALSDGILTGCALSYSGSTLTMAAGQLLVCGRQIRHPSSQNWAVVDATSGYARVVLTIDLTRTASKDVFDQVLDTIEYASSVDGFAALEQADVNASGVRYQVVLAVVSLGTGGITGIVSQLQKSEGSGGGANLFAVISVTYPAGSVCTCTKGTKSYKAKNTSGLVLFAVPEVGDWTVSCTDSTHTASRTVTISAEGQNVNVELSYAILLFKDGNQNPDVTGGWTQGDKWWFDGNYAVIDATIGANIICDITYPQQASARTARPIDLTKWQTLSAYLSILRKPSASITTKCGIAISAVTSGWYDNRVATVEYTSENYTGTTSMDISSLTGNFYVYVYGGIDSCVIKANSIKLSL